MKVTFGEKGCRNATTDFDKLFFISTEHALHLCMGLMKEERAALLAKLWSAQPRVRACVFMRQGELVCVPALCNPRDSVFVLSASYK